MELNDEIVINAPIDRVYKSLIKKMEIADVSATFAMECLKNTTELPV